MIRCYRFLIVLILLLPKPAKAQDTTISMGTIVVEKKPIVPYYKVEYFMRRIADPLKAEKKVTRPVRDTSESFDSSAVSENMYASTDGGTDWATNKFRNNPAKDSLTLEKGARLVFPQKNILLSAHFSNEIKYIYTMADTPRVDTIRIGFWINKQGAIKRVYIRNGKEAEMNKDLYDQVIGAALKLKKWGEPGGYWPRKRFLRKKQFVKDNFYCDAYIIVASYPMSGEQLKSGSHYMKEDVCRNLKDTLQEPKKKKKRNNVETDGEK